jgi:hypothetical protein
MALSGCLINCIYMQITVASVCGQFDRLCLDCIHGQETPSNPGSERQQAVMDNFEGNNKEEQWSVSTGLKQKFGIVAFVNKNLLWQHSNLAALFAYKQTMYVLCFFQVMWVSKTHYKFGNELYNILNLVTT